MTAPILSACGSAPGTAPGPVGAPTERSSGRTILAFVQAWNRRGASPTRLSSPGLVGAADEVAREADDPRLWAAASDLLAERRVPPGWRRR